MELQFNEEFHEYTLGGKKLPSVTQITSSITTHYYTKDIPDYVLEQAQTKGKNVHKAIGDYLNWGEYELDFKYQSYLDRWNEWFVDKQPKILHIEKMLSNNEFAGTIDLICEINGEIWLIDYKTSTDLHKNFVSVQEQGYKELCDYNGIKIDKFGALHLLKDKYEFVEIEPNKEMFEKAYDCYKFGMEDKENDTNR